MKEKRGSERRGVVNNVRRVIVKGPSDERVGVLVGKYDLNSPTSEVLKLEFDTGFKPEVRSYDSESRAAFSVATDLSGRERAIVAPIITISTHQHDLFIMNSKQIMPIVYNSEPSGSKFQNHNGEISIFTIDPDHPTKLLKWAFFIPKNIRLGIKHIYIPKFDMWISKDRNVLAQARDREIELPRINPHSIADIIIKSAIITEQPAHFVFNDLQGKANVEYAPNQVNTLISVRINGDYEPKQFEVNNQEMLDLLEDPDLADSIYHLFVDDRLPLMIDFDRERLLKNYKQSKVSSRSTIAKEYEESLRGNISDLKKKLYDKEEALTALSHRLNRREAKIVDIEGKLAILESATRIRQDEYKTRRDEVKCESAEKSAKSGEISDTLKVVGAVVGFGVLLLTMLHKNTKSGQSTRGLVEWSIPMFGGGGGVLSSMTSNFTTAYRYVGVGAASNPIFIGAGVAAIAGIAATAMFTDKLDPTIEETTEVIKKGFEKVKETVSQAVSWVCETVRTAVTKTYGRVKSVASKASDLVRSASSKVADLFRW